MYLTRVGWAEPIAVDSCVTLVSVNNNIVHNFMLIELQIETQEAGSQTLREYINIFIWHNTR